jgi:molecular chaperone DnaK (HSP70)
MSCKVSEIWLPITAVWDVSIWMDSPAPRGIPKVEVTFDIDANAS